MFELQYKVASLSIFRSKIQLKFLLPVLIGGIGVVPLNKIISAKKTALTFKIFIWSAKYAELFDNVMQIIRKEFANPSLTLDTIAQQVNLSPSYLAKLFKKHHLISMNDFINDVRLQFASERIIATDETITVIMEKSGFTARSHFFTLFKKSYGVSPNQYRSQSRLQTKG